MVIRVGGRCASFVLLLASVRALALGTGSFEKWAEQAPAILRAVSWDEGAGSKTWEGWSLNQKESLIRELGLALQSWQSVRVHAKFSPPPDNLASADVKERVHSSLSPAAAWQLYLEHVGNSLALEYAQRLPWTLKDYNSDELSLLFSSDDYFSWNSQTQSYDLDPGTAGLITPAHPQEVLSFLRQEHLIGSTRLETILRLLNWAGNLRHFSMNRAYIKAGYQAFSFGIMKVFWQYAGFPPVGAVLEGSRQNLDVRDPEFGHWTAGCWGTVGLLKALLRVVNIPAKVVVINGGHAQLHFPSEGLYLSHGDDPYNALVITSPKPIDYRRLLLDEKTWSDWFGEDVIAARNVGRGPAMYALESLPDYLIFKYCEDQALSAPADEGLVSLTMGSYFTPTELKSVNLWTRLAERVKLKNGCFRFSRAFRSSSKHRRSIPTPQTNTEAPRKIAI